MGARFEERLRELKREADERVRREAAERESLEAARRAAAAERRESLARIERSSAELFRAAKSVFGADVAVAPVRRAGARRRLSLSRKPWVLTVETDRSKDSVAVGASATRPQGRAQVSYIAREADPRSVTDAILEDIVAAFLGGEPAPIKINWR